MVVTKKRRVSLFVAVISGVVALLFGPHVIRFESHVSEIGRLIRLADAQDRDLPDAARQMLLYSLDGKTAPYAARLLISRFGDPVASGGGATWTVGYATWSFLLNLQFSQRDRLALIASLAPTGGGNTGLNFTAQALFQQPLSQLSAQQTATLVVLVRQPSLYQQPQRRDAVAGTFLSRYMSRT